MIETADAVPYLRGRGVLTEGSATAEALAGGVSNTVIAVH